MADRRPGVFDADSARSLRVFSDANLYVQCDVQRQITSAKSASGGTTKTPKIVGSHFVKAVSLLTPRRDLEGIDTAGLSEGQVLYYVYFDNDADVSHDDRLVLSNGKTLEVVGIDDAASSSTRLTVLAKEIQ